MQSDSSYTPLTVVYLLLGSPVTDSLSNVLQCWVKHCVTNIKFICLVLHFNYRRTQRNDIYTTVKSLPKSARMDPIRQFAQVETGGARQTGLPYEHAFFPRVSDPGVA